MAHTQQEGRAGLKRAESKRESQWKVSPGLGKPGGLLTGGDGAEGAWRAQSDAESRVPASRSVGAGTGQGFLARACQVP